MTAPDRSTAISLPRPMTRPRWRLLMFLRYLCVRFAADQCTRAAAALAYTSLLALVPFFTVMFLTLAAFPAFHGWREAIENFVFQNFVPALGEQVRGYLNDFSDKARGLQVAGISLLLVTVLALLATIEATFNVIWGVRRQRPLMLRFMVYWALLTLGPILIGAGMIATSYVMALPLLADRATMVGTHSPLLIAVPLAATTLAFFMFFKLIPYRPVPTRHALVGAIVASILFELAKRGFAFFVVSFPSQQAIYGAFATVPIFLTWIYLCWVFVLIGAEITQCLTTFRAIVPRAAGVLAASEPLYGAFRVLLRLHEAQDHGHCLTDKALLKLEPAFDYAAVNAVLETLDAAGWITRNENFEWMLARDPDRLTLLDLLRLTPSFPPPDQIEATTVDAADQLLYTHLLELAHWADQRLRTPLADLMGAAGGRLPAQPPTAP